MGQPRRHHYVSQFYQRGFADNNERVKVVRFDADYQPTVAVRKVAVEKYLYTVDWLPAGNEGRVETLFSKIEDVAARSLRRLLEGSSPTVEDRYHISAWIILQYARGRRKRLDSVQMQKLLLRARLAVGGKQELGDILNLADEAEIERNWEKLVVEGDFSDPSSARRQHFKLIVTLILRIAPVYASAHWRLVKFRKRRLFTSDQPIDLWKEPSADPAVGLLTADAVSIPLDRETGLVIAPNVQDGGLMWDAPCTQLYKGFALKTWLSAEEFLILHLEDELPAWLPRRGATLGTFDFPDIGEFVAMGEAFRESRTRKLGEQGRD